MEAPPSLSLQVVLEVWLWAQLPRGCLTCDIEVGIAGSFAQLVSDDTLVDASVLRSHSREHQAMYIPVWWGRDSDMGAKLGGCLRGEPCYPLQGGGKWGQTGRQKEVCPSCG